MFTKFFTKFNTLADHHQVIVGIILGFSVICLTWGTEKLLETYFFPQTPVIGYSVAVFGSLLMLWLTKHFILHVM